MSITLKGTTVTISGMPTACTSNNDYSQLIQHVEAVSMAYNERRERIKKEWKARALRRQAEQSK